MSLIVTGDAVLLDLRPARMPTRILADIIDIFAMVCLSFGWSLLTAAFAGSNSATEAINLIGYAIVSFGYLITFETLTRGRTPGAFVVGLQTVRDDGGTIRFRHALMRGLAFWLVDYSMYTGFLLGMIVSIVNPQGKRVGDLLAGTIEIRVRAPKASRELPDMPLGMETWAAQLEMSRVTDEEFAAARYALQREQALRPAYRTSLIARLYIQISRKTAPPPPPGLSPETFLVTVLAENRRRANARAIRSSLVPAANELPQGWR